MAQEIVVKTVVETDQAVKSVDNLTDSVDDTSKATEGLTQQLDNMTGGLITAFKGVVAGTKTAIKSMITLKGAIAATGIGLLVLAVGSLVAVFTRTQEGTEKIDKIFNVLGATVDVVIDRLSAFGGGLMNILSGNFQKGLDELAGSFKGVGDEIMEEAKATATLSDALAKLDKQKIDFIVREKELTAAIEDQRLQAETGATLEERISGTNEAIRLTNLLANERIAIAEEDLRIKKALVAQGNSLNEDLEAQAQLEGALFDIQREKSSQLKELTVRQQSLNRELQKTRELEGGEEVERMQPMESMGVDTKSQDDIELQQKEDLNAKKLESDKKLAEQQVELNKKSRQDILDSEMAAAKNKMAIDQMVSKVSSALLTEGTAEAKAFAAGQVIFDTVRGTQAAFATAAASPFGIANPAYPFVVASAAAAFGALSLKNLLQSSPSSGSAPSISGASSIPTQPQQEEQVVPNFEATNQGVGGQQNAQFGNMRAYVVQQDIQNQAALSQTLNDLQKG